MPPSDEPADSSVCGPLPLYLWVKDDKRIYQRLTRHDGGDLYESDDRTYSLSPSHERPDHAVFSDNPSYDPNKDHHLPNPASRYFAGTELQSREKDLLQQMDEKDR